VILLFALANNFMQQQKTAVCKMQVIIGVTNNIANPKY